MADKARQQPKRDHGSSKRVIIEKRDGRSDWSKKSGGEVVDKPSNLGGDTGGGGSGEPPKKGE